jgi:hypothetical protein
MFTLVVMGRAHLLRVLQVPSSSPAARVIVSMMVGPSVSGTRGTEPPPKRARPWSLLPVSS